MFNILLFGGASFDQILYGIVPSLPLMIASLLSLMLLLLVLTHFMYRPITKSIQDRKDYIGGNIKRSEEELEDAKVYKSEAQQEVKDSIQRGKEVVQSSIQQANMNSNQILTDAKDKSQQIVDSARNQADADIKAAKEMIKNEAVALAVELSEKIINEKLDSSSDLSLIDNLISEMEEVE